MILVGRRRAHLIAAGLAAAAVAIPAVAAPWPTPPRSGAQTYEYESKETQASGVSGYRVNFRLRSDGRGKVVAEIVSSETFDGQAWTPVSVDRACAKAMGARPGELAAVELQPLGSERERLGDAFLAGCAPKGVFFPLTDILNIVLILVADRFHSGDLHEVGQSVAFPGFSTSLERLGVQMREVAAGGATRLVSDDGRRAAVDWSPDPAKLDMLVERAAQQVHLVGTEHYAFEVGVDDRTGALLDARSLYDDLDLLVDLPGVPIDKRPRVAIQRTVTIAPRP